MLFAKFNPILHHLTWTINWVLYLDIHIQIRVSPNIDLISGFILIVLCGLLSVSDDTNNS